MYCSNFFQWKYLSIKKKNHIQSDDHAAMMTIKFVDEEHDFEDYDSDDFDDFDVDHRNRVLNMPHDCGVCHHTFTKRVMTSYCRVVYYNDVLDETREIRNFEFHWRTESIGYRDSIGGEHQPEQGVYVLFHVDACSDCAQNIIDQ